MAIILTLLLVPVASASWIVIPQNPQITDRCGSDDYNFTENSGWIVKPLFKVEENCTVASGGSSYNYTYNYTNNYTYNITNNITYNISNNYTIANQSYQTPTSSDYIINVTWSNGVATYKYSTETDSWNTTSQVKSAINNSAGIRLVNATVDNCIYWLNSSFRMCLEDSFP